MKKMGRLSNKEAGETNCASIFDSGSRQFQDFEEELDVQRIFKERDPTGRQLLA